MEQKSPEPIEVSGLVPDGVDISELEIKANNCLKNSYNLSKKYPAIKVVEGIIILRTSENTGKAMPHAWNKNEDIHFDITAAKVWVSEEVSGVVSIKYFPIHELNTDDLSVLSILDFSDYTKEAAKEVNASITGISR